MKIEAHKAAELRHGCHMIVNSFAVRRARSDVGKQPCALIFCKAWYKLWRPTPELLPIMLLAALASD